MENQMYNWIVKKGKVFIHQNENLISLELDYENESFCLLNYSDAVEISDILANIAEEIWKNPAYEKTPYLNQRYKTNEDEYYWEIENSILYLKYNEDEEAIAIKIKGNKRLNIELNDVIEIIQILEHLN